MLPTHVSTHRPSQVEPASAADSNQATPVNSQTQNCIPSPHWSGLPTPCLHSAILSLSPTQEEVGGRDCSIDKGIFSGYLLHVIIIVVFVVLLSCCCRCRSVSISCRYHHHHRHQHRPQKLDFPSSFRLLFLFFCLLLFPPCGWILPCTGSKCLKGLALCLWDFTILCRRSGV